MSKASKIAILLAACGLLVVGCGPEDEPAEPASREPLDGKYGEIFLSYAQPLTGAAEEEASFQVSARFVRVHDVGRREVQSLWGEELPRAPMGQGECEQRGDEARSQDALVLDGTFELLDAGELTLHTDDEALAIPNWSFPSVYGVVAGVLYGGDDLQVGFDSGRSYRIASSGSSEVAAFEVELVAPEVFDDLTIAGAEVGIEPLQLEADQPLEIRWEPGRATNEVVIEVSYALFGSEQRIVCRSQDDGLEELPAALVSALWNPGVSDVRLTLYRIGRTSFEAEGLDDAEAIFVVSAVVPAIL